MAGCAAAALDRPAFGVGEFGAEQPPAQLAETMDVAARQEAVLADTAVASQQAEIRESMSGGERRLVGRTDQGDARPHHVADGASEEGIVRAAEQQCVDISLTNGCEQSLGEHGDLVAQRLTTLDELDEARTCGAHQPDRSAGTGDRLDVRSGRHRADRADHSDPARRRGANQGSRTGLDDIDDRHGDVGPHLVETRRSGGVARHDDRLHVEVVDQRAGDLAGEPANVTQRLRTVRIATRVADVHDVFVGKQIDQGARHRETTEPGVEHADGATHPSQTTGDVDGARRHRGARDGKLITMHPEDRERWSSTVVLGDGDTALIRPITPDDSDDLAAFHVRQSSESRYRRFFSPKPELSSADLERFTTVDFENRVALVVEMSGQFIAWASYERWQNRDDAEVAFMVDDEHQGKGIATLLLEHLAAIAQTNGVSRFTAQTLGDNRSMLSVFAKAGWPVHRRFESGVIDVDFPLADTSEFIDSVERREQRADSRAIARLLLPPSVAIIGASDEPGGVGNALWRHATRSARMPIYAVNPNHETVDGRVAFRSVDDIPYDVGLAVIAVPPSSLEATVQQCIDKRVRGAVVITDTDGTDIDVTALINHARRNGLRLIGPASFGVASPRPDVALQAALVDVTLPPGNVAISMQSGTLGGSLLKLADQLRLGISWFVSLGDKSDVSANDLLQFWEDDEATTVIALYTESLGNPRKFARIARRVGLQRPIVAVRTGAALVGVGNEALFQQTGVIEVPTVAAMLDTARILSTQPLMQGKRVAVVSNSRSPAILAEATIEAAGLEPAAVIERLRWDATAADYERVVTAAMDDDEIHGVMVVHAPPVAAAVAEPVAAIERVATGGSKPTVAVMIGAVDGPLAPGSSVPVFGFVEQAAAALGRIAAYSTWREDAAADETVSPGDVDPPRAGALIDEHLAAGSMPPRDLRQLLAAYGVDMPPTRRLPADQALDAAFDVGYPVAIKAAQRHMGRSVEAGIALDLSEPADVTQAITIMREHLGNDAAEVIVQQMVPPGVDIRVQISTDDRLGPVITVGLGGVQADVIGDEVSRLAPISPGVAHSMISSTRAAGALDDHALDRVTDTVVRIAQLASDHPAIASMDLNPVIVSDDRCTVTDATVILEAPTGFDSALRRLE